MNTTKLVAILLFGVGIIVFAYQGISYKTQEHVVDLGPLHVTAERSHTLPLLPIVGVVAWMGGAVLLATGARKS